MSTTMNQKVQDVISQALIKFSSRQQDAQTTASELTSAINGECTPEEKSASLTLIWRSTLGVVTAAPNPSYVTGTIPEDNQDILTQYVDLIDAIRSTPNPIPADDMASWGAEVREAYNRSPTPPSDSTYRSDEWTNLNSFLALMTSKHTPPPQPLDFCLYAIWALRSALETEQPPDTIKAILPAAAAWIDIPSSGTAIYKNNQQWEPSPHTGAPARTGPLWQVGGTRQENGFSPERWLFWKQRFGQIGDDETYSQATRDTAKAAVLRMNEIENGST